MEELIRRRTQYRRVFTRAYNDFNRVLQDETQFTETVRIAYGVLADKAERLLKIEEEVSELSLQNVGDRTQEELDAEFDTSEAYRDNWLTAQEKYASVRMMTNADGRSITDISASHQRNYKLPKLELKKFNGDVRQWIGFWGQFRKIHDDPNIDVEDKFQYLIQSMESGSPASELIESFPPSAANYPKAILQLKSRFARDEFLIEVYVRELLKLVMQQANRAKSLTLAQLYDKLETQLRALESLGVTSDKYAAMLFPLVESALPEDVMRVWERHRSTKQASKNDNVDHNDTSVLELLLEFLRTEVESEERLNLAKTSFAQVPVAKNKKFVEFPKVSTPTAATMITTEQGRNIGCVFCQKPSHNPQDCFSVRESSIEEKRDKLKKSGACFTCLRRGHNSKFCKAVVKCLVCKRKHFTIMCSDIGVSKQITATSNKNTDNVDADVSPTMMAHQCKQAVLQTLLVRVVDGRRSILVRALIDSGSQCSYIKKECVKSLNLKPVGQDRICHSLFGGLETTAQVHNVFDVMLQNPKNNSKLNVRLLDQEVICNNVPGLVDKECTATLRKEGIFLNDLGCQDMEIKLLLGADIIGRLMTGRIVKVNGNMIATETTLGWTVMGQQHVEQSAAMLSLLNIDRLDISSLWQLDVLGIKDPAEVKSQKLMEEEALHHFEETVSRNEEGRYQVHLPWVEGHQPLGSNRELAESRLISTSKKLVMTNQFENYEKVFNEWLLLGIIEETEDNRMGHYLCHHPVLKEQSQTTKIRPVFDASAKDQNAVSLNSCLFKGINLVEEIPHLIIKFRCQEIGITADIEKAFLQISIAEHDREYMKFIWWADYERKSILVFRHKRVVFGVKSSPFLLNAVLLYHLNRAPEKLKKTAEKLKTSLYIDNCVTSVKNKLECELFIAEAQQLMADAKMNLRGWVSNESPSEEEVSVLGMLWENNSDQLRCNISIGEIEGVVTKRKLLAVAQKIFDPVGFTAPVTIVPKLLLQETWVLKLGWDQELPPHITKGFLNWVSQLHYVENCVIPRRLSEFSLDSAQYSLHVFSDASKSAYAACIFLRVEASEHVSVQLVIAKGRIAPLKQITIPRLELLGAVIAVRLCNVVRQTLNLQDCEVRFWTDSTVVLTWIKKDEPWSVFVTNRCKEIRQSSRPEEWHHIPGNMNPADLPSRGCGGENLLKSQWWCGPEWLRLGEQSWPRSEYCVSLEELDRERRKTAVSTTVTVGEDFTSQFHLSKYSKLVRMVAWILRFISNSLKGRESLTGELTGGEVKEAETRLLCCVQRESFHHSGKPSLTKNMEVYADEKGLLRVKSKLIYGNDVQEFKCPILLSGEHPIVQRLISFHHLQLQHAGTQALLNILREKFWIIKGRKTVKMVIGKCVPCRRHSSKPIETPFAPLPYDRIKDANVFEVTGMDYAGPLFLRSGKKCWIALFTCAVYRAIHLELVDSMSTGAFLLSFRRFIARRGRVSVVYTDNGSHFIGAFNALKEIDWEEVKRETSLKEITWKFIPPTAAWWGGWWERLVGMVKALLKRNLGRARLESDELYTILTECEAVINSRPLTYVSEEPGEVSPLSPSTFLKSIVSHDVADLDTVDEKSMNRRWRYLQQVRAKVKERFRQEYLGMLINRGQRKPKKLHVGDVVIIHCENAKRISWPLGLVVKIFPGPDGITRVARLKTSKGEITRPVQRLHPLELTNYAVEKEGQTKSGRSVKVPQRLDL